jgi:hypothetical protein
MLNRFQLEKVYLHVVQAGPRHGNDGESTRRTFAFLTTSQFTGLDMLIRVHCRERQ